MGPHRVEIGEIEGRSEVRDCHALAPPNDLPEGGVHRVGRPGRPESHSSGLDEIGVEIDRGVLSHLSMICRCPPCVYATATMTATHSVMKHDRLMRATGRRTKAPALPPG